MHWMITWWGLILRSLMHMTGGAAIGYLLMLFGEEVRLGWEIAAHVTLVLLFALKERADPVPDDGHENRWKLKKYIDFTAWTATWEILFLTTR
jgi:hypothetical protein